MSWSTRYREEVAKRKAAARQGVAFNMSWSSSPGLSPLARRICQEERCVAISAPAFSIVVERRRSEGPVAREAGRVRREKLQARVAELTRDESAQVTILEDATVDTPTARIIAAQQTLAAIRFRLGKVPEEALAEAALPVDECDDSFETWLAERVAGFERALSRLRAEGARVDREIDALKSDWTVGDGARLLNELIGIDRAVDQVRDCLSSARKVTMRRSSEKPKRAGYFVEKKAGAARSIVADREL